MKEKSGSLVSIFTMGVAGLFLAGFFLLVVFGAQAYRGIAAGQAKDNQTRALLSYLSTCVKTGDTKGAVSLLDVDGSPALLVADGDSGYGIYIYQREGRLLEEYAQVGGGIDPSSAQVIGDTDVFQVEEQKEGTFLITTDAGRVLFHVRSEGAAKEAADESGQEEN